jgi:hypothetical protein
MSTNAKSLLVAALLIAGLLALMSYLVGRSAPPGKQPGAAAKTDGRPRPTDPSRLAPGSAVPARPAPVVPYRRRVKSDLERRELFASRLQALYARKGKPITVTTSGQGSTSFQLRWPAGAPDRQHIEQLKTARPFHQELRGMGFRSLVVKIGERVVWSLEL